MICWQVFARVIVPGQVKTRLISALGAEGAACLYGGLLRHVLDCLERVRGADDRAELWLDGPDPAGVMQPWAAQYQLQIREQPPGHLGERMQAALETGRAGGRSVVLFGSDLAGLRGSHLRAARRLLHDGSPLVIAPAADGGYGLLGVSGALPPILADMPWSEPELLARTRQRLQAAGWRWDELAALWDVDVPADLARLATVPELARWAGGGVS